jgi:hypothetical protein
MILQFFDFVPGWLSELRDAEVVDDADELAILRLYVYLNQMRGRSDLLEKWSAVADAPEWRKVRELSVSALTCLRGSKATRAAQAIEHEKDVPYNTAP